MNVGQTEISALMMVDEPPVIDAQQVENRGLKIVYVHRIFSDVISVIVGLAVYMSWF